MPARQSLRTALRGALFYPPATASGGSGVDERPLCTDRQVGCAGTASPCRATLWVGQASSGPTKRATRTTSCERGWLRLNFIAVCLDETEDGPRQPRNLGDVA